MHKYNQLMKDFPLNELLSATDLDKIQEAVVLIFGHINRKLKLSPYPIRRALPLVEAISRDFNDPLLRVLTSHRLLYTPYEMFDWLLSQTAAIFRSWDDHRKEFTNIAREVTRKRQEKFIPIKVPCTSEVAGWHMLPSRLAEAAQTACADGGPYQGFRQRRHADGWHGHGSRSYLRSHEGDRHS